MLDMDASFTFWALFLKDAFNKSQAKCSIFPALKNQNFPLFFHGIWEWKTPRCEWQQLHWGNVRDHDTVMAWQSLRNKSWPSFFQVEMLQHLKFLYYIDSIRNTSWPPQLPLPHQSPLPPPPTPLPLSRCCHFYYHHTLTQKPPLSSLIAQPHPYHLKPPKSGYTVAQSHPNQA